MTACFELPQLLDTILRLVEEVFAIDTCAVLLVDATTGEQRIERARGYDSDVVAAFRGKPGQGITGRAIIEGRPVFVANVRTEPSYIGGVSGAVAELAAPMRLNGSIVGVLDAEVRRPFSLSDEDMAIFAAFADHAAVAVQSARLHDQLVAGQKRLERQLDRLHLVGEAAQALSSSLDFDELLGRILDLARQALHFDQCAVLLVEEDELRVEASVGYSQRVANLRIPVGTGVTGEVARTGQPVLVGDVKARSAYIPGVTGGRCEMAAPLLARGRVIGVLDAESTEPGAFCQDDLDLLSTFALQAATALVNADNYRELEASNERLHRNLIEMERMNRELNERARTIHDTNAKLELRVAELLTLQRASQTITSSLDLDATLGAIVKMTRQIIHSSIGVIRLLDEESTGLRGVRATHSDGDEAEMSGGDASTSPGVVMGVPLRIGDRTIGSFEVFRNGEADFNEEERRLLETLASQAAIAIENARLFEDTQRTYFETIRSLAQALEARDAYTKGHSERVAHYAERVARAMRLPDPELQIIGHASLLHDIGKIGIADSVLSKPSGLTAEDRALIEKHPIFGDTIIGPLRFLDKVQSLVRHHHERFDGKGYPNKLSGEDIPLGARIIAVADSYDAMTSRRPYRAPLPREVAIAELERGSGTQFDPQVVAVFLQLLASQETEQAVG